MAPTHDQQHAQIEGELAALRVNVALLVSAFQSGVPLSETATAKATLLDTFEQGAAGMGATYKNHFVIGLRGSDRILTGLVDDIDNILRDHGLIPSSAG